MEVFLLIKGLAGCAGFDGFVGCLGLEEADFWEAVLRGAMLEESPRGAEYVSKEF